MENGKAGCFMGLVGDQPKCNSRIWTVSEQKGRNTGEAGRLLR